MTVLASCRLHINVFVSALVMIKEKVIKSISTEVTNWFAVWNDDRKFHHIAGNILWISLLEACHSTLQVQAKECICISMVGSPYGTHHVAAFQQNGSTNRKICSCPACLYSVSACNTGHQHMHCAPGYAGWQQSPSVPCLLLHLMPDKNSR